MQMLAKPCRSNNHISLVDFNLEPVPHWKIQAVLHLAYEKLTMSTYLK